MVDDHDGWASDGEVEDVEMEMAGEVHGDDADRRDGDDEEEDDAYSLVSILLLCRWRQRHKSE